MLYIIWQGEYSDKGVEGVVEHPRTDIDLDVLLKEFRTGKPASRWDDPGENEWFDKWREEFQIEPEYGYYGDDYEARLFACWLAKYHGFRQPEYQDWHIGY